MPKIIIEHDSWNHSPQKLPKASKIVLPSIYGVLPFDGIRNPGSRSTVSHHVWFTYRTEGNQWQPKVGICESGAEFAVGLESLLDPKTYKIRFQPCYVRFDDKDNKQKVRYTHNFLITRRDGHRRLIFVRNRSSLSKEEVWHHIDQVAAETLCKMDDGSEFSISYFEMAFSERSRVPLGFSPFTVDDYRDSVSEAKLLELLTQDDA